MSTCQIGMSPMTVFRGSELSSWLIGTSKSSEFCLICLFYYYCYYYY